MSEIRMSPPDIAAGRLATENLARGFSDIHPPLEAHEALVEADRCYFCYDAPCMRACPTSIDVPLFIREIQAGNPVGAAKTIFEANILGGMCARVCPTETLCEEACVREAAEGKPVKIGLLQRFATDHLIEAGRHPFQRAAPTGHSVAVVGAGPAGLSCAHRLAMLGHSVTLYDARPKPGGLNEYGIAAYKATNGFAQAEVEFIWRSAASRSSTIRRSGATCIWPICARSSMRCFWVSALPASTRWARKGKRVPALMTRWLGSRSYVRPRICPSSRSGGGWW